MDPLTDRLATLRREPVEVEQTALDADLGRGHRALRRRRRRLAGGAVAVAVVVGGATYVVRHPGASLPPPSAQQGVPETSSPGSQVSTAPPTVSPTAAVPTPVALKLAPYTGEQQPGFTVAMVPEGWVLQGSDAVVLAIARPESTTPVYDFEHKIAVTWNSNPASGGRPVQVGGREGHLRTHDDGSRTLIFPDGKGHVVNIDVWSDVGLNDDQLLSFAEGVRVTKAAQSAS